MKFLKKCGAFVCRSLLGLIQSTNGNLNYIKIGALVGTFGLYSLVFSWKFALLLMISIGWHESGHVWAMRRVGMTTSGFYFIPFVGGVAVGNSNYGTLRDKVIVVLMGPVWGMTLALLTWFAYLVTDNTFLGVAAYWQSILNLFNLLPANPLDGGQLFRSILTSINKKVADAFAFLSVLAFLTLFSFFKSPIYLLVAYFAGKDFWAHYKYSIEAETTPLSRNEIVITATLYGILCSTLLLILYATTAIGANLAIYLK